MARFEDDYESTNQIIGQGAFAQVFLARHKRTGEKVAVKMSNSSSPISQKEKYILEQLSRTSHPNVIRIHNIYDQQNVMLIVEEYCSGGTLYEQMVKMQRFTEEEAIEIISQVAHGLHFLHSNNIVHRDIKPENVLRQLNDNGVELFKITDFGLSSNKEQRMMTTKVGTAYYVAPEILDGRVLQEGYDRTVDTWALGLMFDELIHGSPFYNGQSEEEVFGKIRNEHYFIREGSYRDATIYEPKQFIIRQVLLGSVARDPTKRKELPWIIKQFEEFRVMSSPQLSLLEQQFQPNLLGNVPALIQQYSLPHIHHQQSLSVPNQTMMTATQPLTARAAQTRPIMTPNHPQPQIFNNNQIDLLDLPEQPPDLTKCMIHQLPLSYKVPEEESVSTCCIKCLSKYGIYEVTEYQNGVKQAISEFTTKGFDYYYKPGLFNREVHAMFEKYQDENLMFTIVESEPLQERFTQIGLKYLKRARQEFLELVEGIKTGKGGQFIARAMRQATDSFLTREMTMRMTQHRNDAVRECESILRQSLLQLLNAKLKIE